MENNEAKKLIQKLEDNDLQFSAGWTKVENASSFFKRDRVSATCAHCGATCIVKFNDKFITDMSAIYGHMSYKAQKVWTCMACHCENLTEAKRDSHIFGYDTWWGHTYKYTR